jgi:hypothetical protein
MKKQQAVGEESIFIELLKFGAKHERNGFEKSDWELWAKSHVAGEDGKAELNKRISFLLKECFEDYGSPAKFALKTEYYFRLVEFQELEESRKASSDANFHSKIAIGFSVFAIFVGLVIGIIQLNSEINLNPEQVSVMATKDFPVTQQVESEQLNLVIEALKQSNINTLELAQILREQNAKIQLVSGEVEGK